jgi:hypothetical protein
MGFSLKEGPGLIFPQVAARKPNPTVFQGLVAPHGEQG